MSTHANTNAHHDEVGHHVPFWLLIATLLVLLALTALTVGSVYWIDLGPTGNLWMAMIIATIKAVLVGLIFMHLAWDKPFIPVILIASLAFVLLFIGFTMMDTHQYQQNIQDYRSEDPDARYAPLLHDRELERQAELAETMTPAEPAGPATSTAPADGDGDDEPTTDSAEKPAPAPAAH
jgi:cytochrome c oxidase subunit 4